MEAVEPRPGDLIVDATCGAGGDSRAFPAAGARVLALARDPLVRPHAEVLARAHPGRFRLVETCFSDLESALAETGREACEAVVMDVGVSSMQLDEAERGFS